ncbi:hypothetical protein [Mycobacterium kansasii]|uniref:hypothetical protein n=1 Tax=Mycobacterium kansasii TaxID=1768 RepID=UPI0012EB42F9|nr:hypothetical protein [Mycobacterium kansasii]
MNKLLDWLDLNDYGYPLGLLALVAGGVALVGGLWWLSGFLLILAAVLCWEFG